MTDNGLLEFARRLVVDRDFRERFLIAPQDVLADFGIPVETCRALAAVMPILLAGNIVLMDPSLGDPASNGSVVGWGRG